MKNNDQRSSLFWLVIGLAIALYSAKYGLGKLSSPGPGFMPFLSGLVLAGLALVVFLQQLSRGSKEKLRDLWDQKNWSTIMMVMGALVLYTIFFRFFGFLLDTFLLTALLLRVMEPLSWKKVVAGAMGAAIGSYAIFQLWLKAQLPKGFLGF
ncbi:MAG TPA: tripartite tricarboxylate transporter TctB family protein [Thermodesulfobacteriota bacterium]|jgi:putative tricarboxylic transport membrane protein|nr:tripartite tricarboxylate transporter TctB family protein [Thermodesulfobacteriota bacterium]